MKHCLLCHSGLSCPHGFLGINIYIYTYMCVCVWYPWVQISLCLCIYMVLDLEVLVRSFHCESRACHVGNLRERFSVAIWEYVWFTCIGCASHSVVYGPHRWPRFLVPGRRVGSWGLRVPWCGDSDDRPRVKRKHRWRQTNRIKQIYGWQRQIR